MQVISGRCADAKRWITVAVLLAALAPAEVRAIEVEPLLPARRSGAQIQVAPPPPPPPPSPALPGCPATGRAAVADKNAQRFWLCEDGAPSTPALPMTTASARYGLPPVGVHRVFAKDRFAWGAGGELLHRFVAFYRTPRGNRIAFHQVVNQSPDTVGDLDRRGASAGCLRLRPDHTILVWDYLSVGDLVIVIS